MPRHVLMQRIEGAVIFAAVTYLYFVSGYSWLWFLVLLFSIDASMAGYLLDTKTGAFIYNIGHNFALPILLAGAGYAFSNSLLIAFALIWLAHIGLDRALGFGLKLDSGFKDTHLGKIG